MLKNYTELKVWQKSYELCLKLYRITKKFQKKKNSG
ncbi:four helix bundle protein [Thermodesulfobacteriota bacterium]